MGKIIEAIATLVGMTVGAGILGLPYIFSRAGFFTGLMNLVIIGLFVCILSLYLGEVVLRTKGNHQISGLAKKYLGKTGKSIIMTAMIILVYGSLTAYAIGGGEALTAIFGGTPFVNSLIFFWLFAILIFFGLKIFEESELVLTSFIVIIVLIIAVLSLGKFQASNLDSFSIKNIFMPFGVVLFAFLGFWAIPDMKQELTNKNDLKKAIIIGIVISGTIYLLFSTIVVGVDGMSTTPVATVGLGESIGKGMVFLANLFAIFTMGTSFLALGYALKESFMIDYGIRRIFAWLLTIVIPLTIVLTKITGFIQVISITGAIAGAITAFFIVAMFEKAKKLGDRKPEFAIKHNRILNYALVLLFVVGTILNIIKIT